MYLLSYFRTASEALHFALSEDGLNWRALNGNRAVVTGQISSKTLRDPFVFADQRGRFHLLATDGWAAQGIVHAHSDDLVNWSEQHIIPVMELQPTTRNCWAPEAFFDAEANVYRIIWSSSLGEKTADDDWNHRIWSVETSDFQTISAPSKYFDPGFSVIDANVLRARDQYWMAFKDERGQNRAGTDHKRVHLCRAPRGNGPWGEISRAVSPELCEGPSLLHRTATDDYLMIFDHFMADGFSTMHSRDLVTWQPVKSVFPAGPRHASMLEISDQTAQALIQKWSF